MSIRVIQLNLFLHLFCKALQIMLLQYSKTNKEMLAAVSRLTSLVMNLPPLTQYYKFNFL